tara:strand:- start:71 stop:304 length:234 start_codon:yes stop_codon:yes gene_type:complete
MLLREAIITIVLSMMLIGCIEIVTDAPPAATTTMHNSSRLSLEMPYSDEHGESAPYRSNTDKDERVFAKVLRILTDI